MSHHPTAIPNRIRRKRLSPVPHGFRGAAARSSYPLRLFLTGGRLLFKDPGFLPIGKGPPYISFRMIQRVRHRFHRNLPALMAEQVQIDLNVFSVGICHILINKFIGHNRYPRRKPVFKTELHPLTIPHLNCHRSGRTATLKSTNLLCLHHNTGLSKRK